MSPDASAQRPPQDQWAADREQAILDQALSRVGVLGWTRRAVHAAARAAEVSIPDADLLMPSGPRDLAALYSRRLDARMMARLEAIDAGALKIRERIATGVRARLEAGAEHLEATRRCAGFLSLPMHAPLGLRLAWETADLIWRWAGDRATDENHYSKRAILSGILIPAQTIRWFDGPEAAERFVAARIENVMAFEKWKAGKDFGAPLRQAAETLARVRYGARAG
ncbi:COQ9 family protein [Brevundimonas sp. 2R-24]|uniref:COQ9 family protein n=1 Tax=Peiella sedimenti TaxID=3061083 RepID=A0ABT8SN56_9CAUL|nr:COQ9 family protein [Caulobacteraceae bacterium XZ-24]